MKSLLLLPLLAVTLAAQQATYIATEQITVANVSIGFTAATINTGGGHPQAERAVCRNEQAQIRVRVDGTAPTTTVGTIVDVGDTIQVTGNNALNQFRAIRTGSTSGILTCVYSNP